MKSFSRLALSFSLPILLTACLQSGNSARKRGVETGAQQSLDGDAAAGVDGRRTGTQADRADVNKKYELETARIQALETAKQNEAKNLLAQQEEANTLPKEQEITRRAFGVEQIKGDAEVRAAEARKPSDMPKYAETAADFLTESRKASAQEEANRLEKKNQEIREAFQNRRIEGQDRRADLELQVAMREQDREDTKVYLGLDSQSQAALRNGALRQLKAAEATYKESQQRLDEYQEILEGLRTAREKQMNISEVAPADLEKLAGGSINRDLAREVLSGFEGMKSEDQERKLLSLKSAVESGRTAFEDSDAFFEDVNNEKGILRDGGSSPYEASQSINRVGGIRDRAAEVKEIVGSIDKGFGVKEVRNAPQDVDQAAQAQDQSPASDFICFNNQGEAATENCGLGDGGADAEKQFISLLSGEELSFTDGTKLTRPKLPETFDDSARAQFVENLLAYHSKRNEALLRILDNIKAANPGNADISRRVANTRAAVNADYIKRKGEIEDKKENLTSEDAEDLLKKISIRKIEAVEEAVGTAPDAPPSQAGMSWLRGTLDGVSEKGAQNPVMFAGLNSGDQAYQFNRADSAGRVTRDIKPLLCDGTTDC